MLALKILGVIVLIIAAIMFIPIGADIGYEDKQFRLAAKVCGVQLQLLPKPPADETAPKKEKKPKKPKKEKKPKPEAEGEAPPKKKLSLSFNKDEIFSLVKKALRHFGRFGRKFRVDRFLLHYTAAGDDPYKTAVTFGYVNAALSTLAPMCAQRFEVKDCDVRTDVDFGAEKTDIDFGTAFSIRIGSIFGLAFGLGFSALGILIKNKFRFLREKRQAKKNGSANDDPVVTIEIENTENIQEEERMN